MGRTVRTFIGVEINDSIRARALELIARLGRSPARVKWVAADNLHLTMKFLGEVKLQDVHGIAAALSEHVRRLAPFTAEVHGAGAFPNAARPRTIWLGVREGREDMISLHAAVEKALRPFGFRREGRRFQPHMTIGRVRGAGPSIAELGQLVIDHTEFAAGSMVTDQLVVFSSRLQPTGPIYERLAIVRLEGVDGGTQKKAK